MLNISDTYKTNASEAQIWFDPTLTPRWVQKMDSRRFWGVKFPGTEENDPKNCHKRNGAV